MVGIRVFVTGGIGGVHRGAEISMDISTDLMELSRTPICVVSAGIKSILDVEKTLEVLETNGVCVAVYNSDDQTINDGCNCWEFPAFYTPNSGHFVNYNFSTAKSIAELIDTRDEIGLKMAILLAVPN
ncbi:Indigoidine synthase A-like protein, partial [Euroglyphus maynei]